ncbi:MAG: hypothetical protein ACKOQM_11990 [Novosphingobium sp.]
MTLGALFTFSALLSPLPAMAQDTSAQEARATQTYNDAVDAGQAHRYDEACRGFSNAAVLYENAIGSLMGQSMATEEDRDYIKSYANHLQASADQAKKAAKAACYLRDNPEPDSASSSPAQGSSDLSDSNLGEQQAGVVRTIQLAQSQYQDADRKNKAGDSAGACASARLSADNFAKVSKTLKANRALAATFTQVDQLYANGDQVATDRDNVFCRTSQGSVSMQPKINTALTTQAVTGQFEGAYVCGQGKTALRLDLQAGPDGRLAGTFTFGGSNGVPAGSFAMSGRWNPNGFVLSGDHWINQPDGFSMVDLVGHLAGVGRLSGEVKAQGCNSFDVTRR